MARNRSRALSAGEGRAQTEVPARTPIFSSCLGGWGSGGNSWILLTVVCLGKMDTFSLCLDSTKVRSCVCPAATRAKERTHMGKKVGEQDIRKKPEITNLNSRENRIISRCDEGERVSKEAFRRRDWKMLRFWHADDKLEMADAETGGYLGSDRKKSAWVESWTCECATLI